MRAADPLQPQKGTAFPVGMSPLPTLADVARAEEPDVRLRSWWWHGGRLGLAFRTGKSVQPETLPVIAEPPRA